MLPPFDPERALERVLREEWGRILASLTKTLGDMQLAEDSLQEACVAALKTWPQKGLPKVPAAWLIVTAKRAAIDRIRRRKNFASKAGEIAYLAQLDALDESEEAAMDIPDKRLEMIFTCCHPSLEEKTSIALTLRTLGGLSTEEIASAFLDKPEAMAQRLVRAKKKISAAGIPYKIPEPDALGERLSAVLRVIYLIFNEGYAPRNGESVTRHELSQEAIRLARIMAGLMPQEVDVAGLLALMLLHDARRDARLDKAGNMIALEHQDRGRWNRQKIVEGDEILRKALAQKRIGPYQLQAAISALHATAPAWDETDWPQIAGLYEALYRLEPTPVVRINQAIAVAYGFDVGSGLKMLLEAGRDGVLDRYQPYHAARGDLEARLGQIAAAKESFARAIALSDNQRERDFLSAKSSKLQAQ